MDPSVSPPPMPPSYQSFEDANHLKMLAIGHYIAGGLTAFFSCFTLIYIFMGGAILSGAFPMHSSPGSTVVTSTPSSPGTTSPGITPPPPSPAPPVVSSTPPVSGHPERWMGGFMLGIGLFGLIFGMSLAICLFLVGRWLTARKHPTFCFVVACIQCINMPLGTLLGVFTILVLNRPSVRALFIAGPAENNFVRH
ncbi:MAG TPA: hypothetical protein VM511_09360 [Luteolibacter sp.]|nr:hypothetical protein [Luteolibacter sp.]